jgi:enamine deaminase RidA (YjgF/YER057c/UK114 family)
MRKLIVPALLALVAMASQAQAQAIHIGDPKAPIASAVAVPAGYDMLYVSGITATPVNLGPDGKLPAGVAPEFGDTATQVTSELTKIGDILKAAGYGYGDVVMMRVYLVGDPTKGGKMDFPGLMSSYTKLFGTPGQPNKPARVTMQVAALVAPGLLAEIEVQAARPKQ